MICRVYWNFSHYAIHIVCFEIRGYNTVSIIKECLHNALSEVTICARNQDFHLILLPNLKVISLVDSPAYFIARQQACIQITVAIYTQARLRTSLFCFLLYQLSLWWVKYRAQPEAIST